LEVKVLYLESDVETSYRVRVIASKQPGEEARVGPGTIARDTRLRAGMVLGVVADPYDLSHFVVKYNLKQRRELCTFTESLSLTKSGIGEVVIPPGSSLIGKSARDVWMRKTYALAMIGLHRDGETLREGMISAICPCRQGIPWWCTLPGTYYSASSRTPAIALGYIASIFVHMVVSGCYFSVT
jgi:hypothetical protein